MSAPESSRSFPTAPACDVVRQRERTSLPLESSGGGVAVFNRAGLVLMCAATLLSCASCGRNVIRPTVPPQGLAPLAFQSVVWLDGGAAIAFQHTPVETVSINPRTGDVEVVRKDSLSGWWTIRASGASLRR